MEEMVLLSARRVQWDLSPSMEALIARCVLGDLFHLITDLIAALDVSRAAIKTKLGSLHANCAVIGSSQICMHLHPVGNVIRDIMLNRNLGQEIVWPAPQEPFVMVQHRCASPAMLARLLRRLVVPIVHTVWEDSMQPNVARLPALHAPQERTLLSLLMDNLLVTNAQEVL